MKPLTDAAYLALLAPPGESCPDEKSEPRDMTAVRALCHGREKPGNRDEVAFADELRREELTPFWSTAPRQAVGLSATAAPLSTPSTPLESKPGVPVLRAPRTEDRPVGPVRRVLRTARKIRALNTPGVTEALAKLESAQREVQAAERGVAEMPEAPASPVKPKPVTPPSAGFSFFQAGYVLPYTPKLTPKTDPAAVRQAARDRLAAARREESLARERYLAAQLGEPEPETYDVVAFLPGSE